MAEKKSPKDHRPFGLSSFQEIAIIAVLFVVFLLLFYLVEGPKLEPSKNKTIEVPGKLSNVEFFSESLHNATEVAIVENVTDAPAGSEYMIYNCGTGLLGSATSLGKEATLYVISGVECTRNVPPKTVYYNCTEAPPENATKLNISDTFLGVGMCAAMLPAETQQLSTQECTAQYNDKVYFHIQYGPALTTFLPTVSFILIDETFTAQCGFQLTTE